MAPLCTSPSLRSMRGWDRSGISSPDCSPLSARSVRRKGPPFGHFLLKRTSKFIQSQGISFFQHLPTLLLGRKCGANAWHLGTTKHKTAVFGSSKWSKREGLVTCLMVFASALEQLSPIRQLIIDFVLGKSCVAPLKSKQVKVNKLRGGQTTCSSTRQLSWRHSRTCEWPPSQYW